MYIHFFKEGKSSSKDVISAGEAILKSWFCKPPITSHWEKFHYNKATILRYLVWLLRATFSS